MTLTPLLAQPFENDLTIPCTPCLAAAYATTLRPPAGQRKRNPLHYPLTLERDQARNVDNLAIAAGVAVRAALGDGLASDAAARLEHVLAGVARDLKDRVEVDLENLLPVVVGKDLDGVSALDTT